jgi:alcohol dehydrogenase (cytochrome c)
VALSNGRVFRGTSDGYLLALDAADGTMLWARKAADASIGETFTMAPLVWQDLVFIGPAISEAAIKGWIGAFRTDNGAPVWRFNIVPLPGEPGFETWTFPTEFPVGGGGVWTPLSLDVARGVLFVPATNPAPDLALEARGGTNLYTNSLIALNARTGKLSWYDQLVPNDEHDWDLTQVSPLFRATVKGKERNVVATAGKDGLMWLLDRDTHERLWSVPVTTRENVSLPVTSKGVRVCPGILGGVEWNGPAYNPGTNLLYVPAVDWCGTFAEADTIRHDPGESYLGGSFNFDKQPGTGWITAVDATTGQVKWRYHSPRPMVGAVASSAGGVLFAGEVTGDLVVFDAATGKELYRFHTGGPIGGGLVTYAVGDAQYVAIASGRPSRFWVEKNPGSPTLFVFKLGT